MQEFIQHSLSVLKKKSILLAFDDVDTHFKRGWEVLEMIRRYLQSPHFIILITGDLQLYTHLVRGQQFKQFDGELHKVDSARETERKGLVDHLEQQYLMKLFPLENRIHLYPLAELLSENEIQTRSEANTQNKPHHIPLREYKISISQNQEISLIEFVDHMIRSGFLIKGDISLYRTFFLNLPIRAILQILRQYNLQSGASAPKKLAETLRSALIGNLYQAGIDVDALSHYSMGKLIEAVFDAVVSDGEFDTGIYLRPQPSEEGLRNVYFALSAEVAAQCDQQPDRALRYLLAGLGAVSLLHKRQPPNTALNHNSPHVMTFKKDLSVGRDEDALNWARYAAPILLSATDNNGAGPGVLKLVSGKSDNSTGKQTFESLLGANSTLHSLQQVSLHIASHQVETPKNGMRLYLSVFNLLGALERLLHLGQTDGDLGIKLHSTLNALMSRVTVTVPGWALTNQASNEARDEIDEEDDSATTKLNEKTLAYFITWLENANKLAAHIHPSSLFLGKIWPRLYFSLLKVAEGNKLQGPVAAGKKILGAGDRMHLNVLCIINAFLIEEQDHHWKSNKPVPNLSPLDRTNPVTSSSTLMSKISKIQDEFKKHIKSQKEPIETTTNLWNRHFPMTMLIASCPLLIAFYNTESDIKPPNSTKLNILNEVFCSAYSDQLPEGSTQQSEEDEAGKSLAEGIALLNKVAIVSPKAQPPIKKRRTKAEVAADKKRAAAAKSMQSADAPQPPDSPNPKPE